MIESPESINELDYSNLANAMDGDTTSAAKALLDIFHVLSGFDAAIITLIKGDSPIFTQEIVELVASSDSQLKLSIGDNWEWHAAGCKLLREAGELQTANMQLRFPGLQIAKDLEVKGYISIPIEAGPEKTLVGTFCALSKTEKTAHPTVIGWAKFFASSIGSRIYGELQLKEQAKRAEKSRIELAARADRFAQDEHRIKTAINVIHGWLEILTNESVKPEIKAEALEIALRRSEHLYGEVTRMIDFAKTSFHELRDVPIINISETVKQTIANIALPRSVELSVTENLWGHAYSDALRDIVEHILDNSFRYGGDLIRLSVDREQDRILVSIFDSGNQSRKAELSSQNLSLENRGGTGTGISTVRRLASSMGAVFFMDMTDSGTNAGVSLKLAPAKRDL